MSASWKKRINLGRICIKLWHNQSTADTILATACRLCNCWS